MRPEPPKRVSERRRIGRRWIGPTAVLIGAAACVAPPRASVRPYHIDINAPMLQAVIVKSSTKPEFYGEFGRRSVKVEAEVRAVRKYERSIFWPLVRDPEFPDEEPGFKVDLVDGILVLEAEGEWRLHGVGEARLESIRIEIPPGVKRAWESTAVIGPTER